MTDSTNNVTPISAGRGSGPNGGGGDFSQRLAGIEAKLEFFATKEDIQKVKTWVLAGVLGGMSVSAILAVSIARFVFSN